MNPIFDAVLEALAALELHAGEAFDERLAIKAMENVASILQNADEDVRARLANRAAALAANSDDPERKGFFEEFAVAFGLIDPEGEHAESPS
jgi:hypothetical protein